MSEEGNKVIKTTDADGNEFELEVRRPNNMAIQNADLAYKSKMAKLVRQRVAGEHDLFHRSELDSFLEKGGIWSTEDEVERQVYAQEYARLRLELETQGGSVSEARDKAFGMIEIRNRLMQLLMKRQEFESLTIESVAAAYRLGALCVECVFDKRTGEPFFAGYEDFMEREGTPAVADALAVVSGWLGGLVSDAADSWYEVDLLRNLGCLDEQRRLTDRKGRLVDQAGKLIDDDGRFVDEDGNIVDSEGNPVAAQERRPFIDDDTGEEVWPGGKPEAKTAVKSVKKPRRRKRKAS